MAMTLPPGSTLQADILPCTIAHVSSQMTVPCHYRRYCIAALVCCIATKYNSANAFVASQLPKIFPACVSSANPSLQAGLRRAPTQSAFPTRASSPAQSELSNDPRSEHRTTHQVILDLPLGIVLEEMDSNDPSCGVSIVGINDGNGAKYNDDIFSRIKSREKESIDCSDDCICIRDKIMSISGRPCHDKGFDDVISLISSAESPTVTLELGRIEGSTVVNYHKGICISAKPGESYGFLAMKCGIGIDYECRTGNCQTCMRWMEFPDKSPNDGEGNLYERTVLHCVGKVPRRYQWLHVLEPYRDSADSLD